MVPRGSAARWCREVVALLLDVGWAAVGGAALLVTKSAQGVESHLLASRYQEHGSSLSTPAVAGAVVAGGPIDPAPGGHTRSRR